MAKTRRAKSNRRGKSRSKLRHVKGGMLKAAVGLAALASHSPQSTGLVSWTGSPPPRSTALATYTPASVVAAAPAIVSSPSYTDIVPSSAPVVQFFTDAKGSSISREEGNQRIAAWKAEVEAASAEPSKSANNVCASPIPAPVCEGNIGIPRSLMPQIKRSARGSFLAFVTNWTGKDVVREGMQMNATELQPSQREIMANGIKKIKNKLNKGEVNPNPIIVARNPVNKEVKVVDGHHRWAAAHGSKDYSIMNVTILDIPIEEALEIAAAWGAPREDEKS